MKTSLKNPLPKSYWDAVEQKEREAEQRFLQNKSAVKRVRRFTQNDIKYGGIVIPDDKKQEYREIGYKVP